MKTDSVLFDGLASNETVLLTHGDSIQNVAEGFRIIATHSEIVCGIEDTTRKIFAVQFHPEVELSLNGVQMFRNFLFKIVGCAGDFTIEDRETTIIRFAKLRFPTPPIYYCKRVNL